MQSIQEMPIYSHSARLDQRGPMISAKRPTPERPASSPDRRAPHMAQHIARAASPLAQSSTMARVHPMFVIERCHVCGLVLRPSQILDQDAAGRWVHRACDPAIAHRERHCIFMQLGLSTLVYVIDPDGQHHEVPTTRGMPVSLFKEALMLRTGVPIAEQRLQFRGAVLGDGVLEAYGIAEHDTVVMAGRRRALVVEALQTVIRHEREPTVARLRAELEQTRAERDEAYASLRRIRHAVQDETNHPSESYQVLFYIADDVDAVMAGELYRAAVRRG